MPFHCCSYARRVRNSPNRRLNPGLPALDSPEMSSSVASTITRIVALLGSTPSGRSAMVAPLRSLRSIETSAGDPGEVVRVVRVVELRILVLEPDAAALGLVAQQRVGLDVHRHVGVVRVQRLVELEPDLG